MRDGYDPDNPLSPGLGRGNKRSSSGMEPSLSRDVKLLRAQQEAIYRQRADRVRVRSTYYDDYGVERKSSRGGPNYLYIAIAMSVMAALFRLCAASIPDSSAASYTAPIYNMQGECTNCGSNQLPSFETNGNCTNCVGTNPSTGFAFPDVFTMPTWNNGTSGSSNTAPNVQPNMPSVPSFSNPSVPSMPSGGVGGFP